MIFREKLFPSFKEGNAFGHYEGFIWALLRTLFRALFGALFGL